MKLFVEVEVEVVGDEVSMRERLPPSMHVLVRGSEGIDPDAAHVTQLFGDLMLDMFGDLARDWTMMLRGRVTAGKEEVTRASLRIENGKRVHAELQEHPHAVLPSRGRMS